MSNAKFMRANNRCITKVMSCIIGKNYKLQRVSSRARMRKSYLFEEFFRCLEAGPEVSMSDGYIFSICSCAAKRMAKAPNNLSNSMNDSVCWRRL